MRRSIIFFAAWVCPTAAFAQSAGSIPDTVTPQRGDVELPSASESLSAKEVREGMVKFARCIAGRHQREAEQFVLTESDDSWRALEKRIDNDCVLDAVQNPSGEVNLSTNSNDLLFALAEALVQKKMRSIDPSQFAASVAPQSPTLQGDIGDCAIHGDPIGAYSMLKTRINSKEEVAALKAFAPSFARCTPVGVTLSPDMTRFRGTVAVYYYRMISAPSRAIAAKSERGQ